MVPQHVFSKFSNTDLTTGNLTSQSIVGTGPYLYQSGFSAQSPTMVWKRNDNWWAIKALGLKVGPTYVVDIKNGTNAAALANFQAGSIDLFNNFAPKAAIKGSVKTYFSGTPYHLGANTVWLFPNTTEKPLNDAQFRRALAYSINLQQILDKSYQGMAAKASPTGLLPIWNKWINKSVVSKYGFSYNVAKAKAILAAAGYKDTNGDGYVENKDGSKIDLKLAVPNGWSDWMTATQVISDSAKAVGIKVTPEFPEYATLVDDRGHANFDLVLGNDKQYSNTPWTYYQYIYQLPLSGNQTSTNYERYTDQSAWNLTQKLDKTLASNTAGVPVRDDAARDHVPAEPARDSAVVQRHVGDVQHEVLDELALLHGQPVHPQLLAELLPDDEHRHVHASASRQDVTGAKGAPIDARDTPPGLDPGGVFARERSFRGRDSMARYLTRKICIYLVTFWVAVTIDWAIPRFMPGDPIQQLLSRMQAQPGAQTILTGYYTKAFGFDVPLWKQYLNFWAALFRGDLGRSIMDFPTPVSTLIFGALPYTLALLVPAILLSFWAGNKVGALAARRKSLDNGVLPVRVRADLDPADVARARARMAVSRARCACSRSPARTASRCSPSGRRSSSAASSTTGCCRSSRCSSSPSAGGRSGCGT